MKNCNHLIPFPQIFFLTFLMIYIFLRSPKTATLSFGLFFSFKSVTSSYFCFINIAFQLRSIHFIMYVYRFRITTSFALDRIIYSIYSHSRPKLGCMQISFGKIANAHNLILWRKLTWNPSEKKERRKLKKWPIARAYTYTHSIKTTNSNCMQKSFEF